MDYVDRIFSLMSSRGITQADLSNALGITQAAVSSWKTKGKKPSQHFIAPIAAYLGVSVDYLLTGDNTVLQGVFGDGNHHNAVNVGSTVIELTEFARELLRVYAALDARGKNALLSFAYDLEKKIEDK